jgi:nitroreductase
MREQSLQATATDLAPVSRVVKSRRTNLLIDQGRAVDDGLVTDLLELIRWAPNHKRTWPWQVAVFTGDSRGVLGEACATDGLASGITDDAKLTKLRGKYNRAPVVIAVGQIGYSGAVEQTMDVSAGFVSTQDAPRVDAHRVDTQRVDAHRVDAHRVGEDRDAVAAGIQNFLLGATAAGLASYWGSATDPVGPALLGLCGFASTSRVNALIYLGWPASNQEPPARSELPITWHR